MNSELRTKSMDIQELIKNIEQLQGDAEALKEHL